MPFRPNFMNRQSITKAKNLIHGICAFAVFALLVSVVSINAQTTLPATTGVSFQTSGRSRAATIGDWYTTETSSSTDRIHRFAVDVTQQMITASGGSVRITINDAESTAGTGPNDEVAGTSDPTRFTLRTRDGVSVLDTRTINSGSANGTTITFTVTTAGTYQITSETGAYPINGDTTVTLNDDDNAFTISIPSYGAGQTASALIGQFQSSFQQDTGASLTVPFYFLVGPGTSNLTLRNFDMDNGGTITYTRPSGATVAGTVSNNGIWNGGGSLNAGSDSISGLTLNDTGAWGLTVNNLTTNNQMILEVNGGSTRLAVYNSQPDRAGNFTLTPSTTRSTTIGTPVDHPFTVTNNFLTNDIINLTLSGTSANYTVQLLDSAGNALTDSDGNGVLDTGILTPGQTKSMILRVTPTTGAGATDVTRISGVSYMDNRVDSANNTILTVDKTTTRTAPVINLVKSVSPTGDQLPGTDLTYQIAFTNSGNAAANNFRLTDPDPSTTLRLNTNTDFKIGSAASTLGTTGLTVAVTYSNDNGATFAYTPVSAGGGAPAGYDRNVTHIRWAFTGSLSQTAPNNTGNVSFIVRIR